MRVFELAKRLKQVTMPQSLREEVIREITDLEGLLEESVKEFIRLYGPWDDPSHMIERIEKRLKRRIVL